MFYIKKEKKNLCYLPTFRFSLWIAISMASLKCALSSLIQVLATESYLDMMKNAFYFTLKALFVLKIFKLLP